MAFTQTHASTPYTYKQRLTTHRKGRRRQWFLVRAVYLRDEGFVYTVYACISTYIYVCTYNIYICINMYIYISCIYVCIYILETLPKRLQGGKGTTNIATRNTEDVSLFFSVRFFFTFLLPYRFFLLRLIKESRSPRNSSRCLAITSYVSDYPVARCFGIYERLRITERPAFPAFNYD